MTAIYWNDGAELYHYGVSGQKWGNRRWQNPDGTLTAEGRIHYGYGNGRRTRAVSRGSINRVAYATKDTDSNGKYTSEQRKRDLAVYGRTGVKRIERDINNGIPISGARSREADRINKARDTAKVVGAVGSAAGSIIATVGARYLLKDKVLMDTPISDLAVKTTISIGASSVGSKLGKIGGESITMLMYGYNPKKLR